jgi:hypothetical protein
MQIDIKSEYFINTLRLSIFCFDSSPESLKLAYIFYGIMSVFAGAIRK